VIRKSAGVVVLGTVAAVTVVLSVGGASQGGTPPAEHAAAWTPPAPSEVPLDCLKGMTFAPAPPANPHAPMAAARDAAEAPGAPAVAGAPSAPSPSPTPHVLAEVMTAEARSGYPELVAGFVRYEVAEQHDADATLVGTLGGRRLVLAPAVRNADGTWSWRDARPVLNPNGALVMQGTMVACNEVFDRA